MSEHARIVPVTEYLVPILMHMIEELIGLSVYGVPVDRAYTTRMILHCLPQPQYFGRIAITKEEGAVGFIIGYTTPLLFSPKIMAVEETIYVREGVPFRAGIGRQLLQSLTDWAFNERNAEYLRVGETSGINPTAVDLFYRSQGFKRIGTVYNKERV